MNEMNCNKLIENMLCKSYSKFFYDINIDLCTFENDFESYLLT